MPAVSRSKLYQTRPEETQRAASRGRDREAIAATRKLFAPVGSVGDLRLIADLDGNTRDAPRVVAQLPRKDSPAAHGRRAHWRSGSTRPDRRRVSLWLACANVRKRHFASHAAMN